MTERTLCLYLRQHCSLCEEMVRELVPWRKRLGFQLKVVDIDADDVLKARFDYKVPVLAEGDEEICHHFLDEYMLQLHFKGS